MTDGVSVVLGVQEDDADCVCVAVAATDGVLDCEGVPELEGDTD